MAGNGNILQIDGKEIGVRTQPQFSAGHSKGARSMNRGALKKPRRQRLSVYLIEDRALLLLQPQMVMKLTRIFERIDLGLAGRAKRNANARCHHTVRRQYSIAEVALRRWSRA